MRDYISSLDFSIFEAIPPLRIIDGPAAPADEALHLSNEGSKFASLAIYFTAYK